MEPSTSHAYLENGFVTKNKSSNNKMLRFWLPGREQIESFTTDIVLRAVQVMVCK